MNASSRTFGLGLLAALAFGTACRLDYVVGTQDEDTVLGADAETDGGGTVSPGSTSFVGDGSTADGIVVATESGESSTGIPILDDDSGPLPECQAPQGRSVCDDDDPFRVLGLNCSGSTEDAIPIANPQFASTENAAWRVAREYGNLEFVAIHGNRLLIMSTGTIPDADTSDRIELPLGQTDAVSGDNANPDAQLLPAPVRAESGAPETPFVDCDGLGDCSQTLTTAFVQANDLIYFRFEVTVPDGTFGYQVDLAWFSSEFPARVDQGNNDLFVWWQSSQAFTGNIATLDGAPMSATGLRPFIVEPNNPYTATGNSPKLQDTGFEGVVNASCSFPWGTFNNCPSGATTGWMTLEGRTQPGENLVILAALFDQGDRELDTTVLMDNWRWKCAGCQLGTNCGLRPIAR